MPTTRSKQAYDPSNWKKSLKLLRGKLGRYERNIYDTLPLPGTLFFPEVNGDSNENEPSLYLGLRKLSTPGNYVRVYATLRNDSDRSGPRMAYRERVPSYLSTPDNKHEIWPRQANSLLLRPSDLDPPFCFLHFDTENKLQRRNIKNLLKAVVLYYFAASGKNHSAFRWDRFSEWLNVAMRHIGDSPVYQAWMKDKRGPAKKLNRIAALHAPHDGDLVKAVEDTEGFCKP